MVFLLCLSVANRSHLDRGHYSAYYKQEQSEVLTFGKANLSALTQQKQSECYLLVRLKISALP